MTARALRKWFLLKSAILLRKFLIFLSAGSLAVSCVSENSTGNAAVNGNVQSTDSALMKNKPIPVVPAEIIDESIITPTLYGVVPVYDPEVQPATDYGVLPDFRPTLE